MIVMGTLFGTNDYVKVEVVPSSLELENGTAATFGVWLKAGEGVHVNARPAVTVKSETRGADFSIEGIQETGDIVDLNQPLRVECRIDGLAPGTHRVDFLLKYTYCSDKEKWCRMGQDSLSLEIEVKK